MSNDNNNSEDESIPIDGANHHGISGGTAGDGAPSPEVTPVAGGQTDEESLLQDMLESVDVGLPSPEPEFLLELKRQSTEVFLDASATSNTTTSKFSWSRIMRFGLTVAAGLVLIFGFRAMVQPSRASAPKFSEVLARMDRAGVLELKIVRNGTESSVWVQQPGLVRWEYAESNRYQIARGSRLWTVDSTEQLAEESQANPWLNDSGSIDLFSMLSLPSQELGVLIDSRPTNESVFAGVRCLVYEQEVRSGRKDVRVQAFVDKSTSDLVGIVARDPGQTEGPPLAELTLISLNPQIDEDQFQVPVKLANTDRVGKIIDAQGTVTIRPIDARRWTPICGSLLVRPGDWIRAEPRGANASTVLLGSTRLVLGPGSLLEAIGSNEARLHRGFLQIKHSKGAETNFVLYGASDQEIRRIPASTELMVEIGQDETFEEVRSKPVWLTGYEGSSSEDSLGSLIVNVDGREQSLSVGEHHVLVEIRDQIARTTIEETFVNHTDRRLEGQFHFPLPQDASISGFGMWINGELIEADVVEKQRAREIYETILREKRDPGLLEWTGGNIFKARVFPIEAHSEKRVKITYTQVLPLRNNRFRYSYALRSEMLQTNPLRELNIKCVVNSAVPLQSVESPTHACRTQTTSHSAEVEFSAQEYTPKKDFELVCEVDHRENDVVVIPHQRGNSGYFLMQLMPPGVDRNWSREVVADGEPLELIFVCDTSGSMDNEMRSNQRQFVAAMLSSLSGHDRFQLVACDVGSNWKFDSFVKPTEENIAAADEFLEGRVSLGWTDLDQALASALEKSTATTQIVYVGDGVVSTVDNDAGAFANRLQRMIEDVAREGAPAIHAVSVGSSFESTVLNAMASYGQGSSRQISGETTPQQAALELLQELTQPGLKDVEVEFRGVQVAAVYPERLPNIAAGTQQVLVGRYLPEGGDAQQGEVIVTGTQDGKPVKFVARIEFAEAEQGNSFIPRLWARGHLGSLLLQGSNQQIQDEIIALSEEFHIITPYTSLLVLESDEDRERFGVKRRFEMRDGEEFFAKGRDDANYELRQRQMRRAGTWRLGLRSQILSQLVRLGRSVPQTHRLGRESNMRFAVGGALGGGGYGGTMAMEVVALEAGDLSMEKIGLAVRGFPRPYNSKASRPDWLVLPPN